MSLAIHPNGHSIGVVLFQLGGPDSLEAVEPFLYNLFSDPDIIDFPFARLARPTLARLISSRRAKKVREHYASIGGKSPIRELTDRQATALELELRKTLDARVFVAMRYWNPLTEETARQVAAFDFCELVLLPLYPQYSKTTTGSSLNEWRQRYKPSETKPSAVRIVQDFYSDPAYIDAVVERINQALARFTDPMIQPEVNLEWTRHDRYFTTTKVAISHGTEALSEHSGREPFVARHMVDATTSHDIVHLVFSAHGLPLSVIEAGDPYQTQVAATAKLVMERGGWPNRHRICYQSRVGPGRWLRPSLDESLHSLAAQGATKVLVIPISFVSDHVETLSEIDIEAREVACGLGIREFEVMPALNDSPKFIQALAGLVLRELGVKAAV